MTNVQIKSKGNSRAEDRFIELFCDTFGADTVNTSRISLQLSSVHP